MAAPLTSPTPRLSPSANPGLIESLNFVFACNGTQDGKVEGCLVESSELPGLISDSLMPHLTLINGAIIVLTINTFGSIANAINMAVFLRSGFKDTINISLFALALSDFGACFSLTVYMFILKPIFTQFNIPFAPREVQYLASSWPHLAFTKITTLITTFITLERYLCVSKPLKVRTLITRGRVIAYLTFSYLLIGGIMVAFYSSNRLGWRFFPQFNQSRIASVFSKDRAIIESVLVFPFFNVILSGFSFLLISVFTALLILKLRQTAKWRQSATTANKDTGSNPGDGVVTTKEQKVSRMVATLSTLFIIGFAPTVIVQIVMWADRRVSIDGQFSNLVVLLAYFTFIFESFNSAINIVVYYNKSSNYRVVFNHMFGLAKKK